MDQKIIRVAVFAPLRRLFDYLPKPDCTILPGQRVRIPFGKSQRVGVVIEKLDGSSTDSNKLKAIEEVIDNFPLFSQSDIDFLSWVAGYYQHPPGEVFSSALPILFRMGETLPDKRLPGWRLTDSGKSISPDTLKRSPQQARLLDILLSMPHGISKSNLNNEYQISRSALQALKSKQWIEEVQLEPIAESLSPAPPPDLNQEQQQAAEAVQQQSDFKVFLLDGITGSGKTEVYLEIAKTILEQGKQILVLVPEIALTPQTTHRFRTRLGIQPTVMHSALSDKERAIAWLSATMGESQLLLGTRSTVLTPLPNLGLVIIDEEHDLSFKQQEGFRYSARDLAVIRGQRADCPVVLGSATPSLESLHNVDKARFQALKLTKRAGAAQPPTIQLLDIRSAPLQAGLSRALLKEVEQELKSGHQVILFLNRRGYAPVLTCHDCGWTAKCSHCDARPTVHRQDNSLWCHHCGAIGRLPNKCPDCNSERLITLGQGTEQVEVTLNELYPDYSVARIDRDSTRRKGQLQLLLEEIREGKHQLLLGTQMLAKGHDFPNVTLVGILDIDQGLFGADYRAPERMAQLLIQVAGRAGRADKPGRVVVQTRHADHPFLNLLINQGYRAFSRDMLAERHAAQLPPFFFQVMLRSESARNGEAETFLRQAFECGKKINSSSIQFWGPAPAPMEKRAGRFRYQLLVQSANRSHLHRFLRNWMMELEKLKTSKYLRWSIDVDPQEML